MRILLLPVIGAMVAVGVATAAPALADEPGYFKALTDYGYGDTSTDVALKFGYAVCDDVTHGVPKPVTLKAIYDNTGEDVTAADADFIYKAAIVHLC
jgi:hypothetical protein